MGSLKFGKRSVGQFFEFERDIIGSGEHKGWVKYVDSEHFQLLYNPWMEITEGRPLYLLREGLTANEGSYVELDVQEKINHIDRLQKGSTLADKFHTCHLVSEVRVTKPKIKRHHYITENDFKVELCSGWKNPELDAIDQALALHALSCPPRRVSVGGVGSIAMHHRELDSDLTGIRQTLERVLPEELLNPNRHSFLGLPSTYPKYIEINSQINKANSREISFNYTTRVLRRDSEVRINVPILMSNSKFIGQQSSPTPDFLEYLMNAHVMDPEIDPGIDKMLDSYLKEIRDEFAPKLRDFNIIIDPNSISRLALSMCRLKYLPNLDGTTVREAYNYARGQYEDFHTYLKREYAEYGFSGHRRHSSEIDSEEDFPAECKIVWYAIKDEYDKMKSPFPWELLAKRLEGRVDKKSIQKWVKYLHSIGYVIESDEGRKIRPIL